MHSIRKLLPIWILLFLMASCYEDLDDVIRPSGELEIKNFIWRGMNEFYLYKSEVPDLSNDRFKSQAALNEFLQAFSSPEDLFYTGLVAEEDAFSFLVSDYVELEKALDGVRVTNGMQFGLRAYSSTSSKVLGYVRYVLPNTSAEAQGIQRGMLFNTVDGVQLTRENFSRLLEPDEYTVGLATLEGGQVVPTGETVTLEKQEYTTNPVYLAKTIPTANGLVGYLIYNGFTSTFDTALNQTFAMFKSEGISHLVLDLRYNGGGSVETATDLASMITGHFEGEVFFRKAWNEDYQNYFEANHPETLVQRFNGTIGTGAAINSLNLNSLYVLTTLRTASASELLINGLDPYIQVKQVGGRTTGKFQASTTLYDSEDFGRSGANLGHRYAIQPLIYKTINIAGYTDYHQGLMPDIEIQEDIYNLGILGDPEEPLLEAALRDITGKTQESSKRAPGFQEDLEGPYTRDLLFQKMYLPGPSSLHPELNPKN